MDSVVRPAGSRVNACWVADVAWPPCDGLVIPTTAPAAADTAELEACEPNETVPADNRRTTLGENSY